MNAEIVARLEAWCDALESGQYTQGRARLRTGNTYCCLGVACDLSEFGEWVPKGISWYYSLPDEILIYSSLDYTLANYYGLNEDKIRILTEMNDGTQRSFAEIAAYIRQFIIPRHMNAPLKSTVESYIKNGEKQVWIDGQLQ